MSISILGTGNMAKGLATLFAKSGHSVTLASRQPARAQTVAAELGNGIKGAGYADAAKSGDIVVLAVPYAAAADVIAAAGDLAGKVVVDITNPLTADYSGLTIGHTTSAAEEIQKHAARAKVVKAFNTIFAQVLQAGGKVAGQPATVLVAGNDAAARKTVADLAQSAGLVPLDAGDLTSARFLEPLAALNIKFGYGLGHGTDIGPAWQRAD